MTTTQATNNKTPLALQEAQQSAHNLSGVNTARFNPSPSFRARSSAVPPPAPDPNTSEDYDVVKLERQEQYLHARVECNNETSSVHAPTFVNKLIFQLRKGGPSVHILPFNLGTFKSSDIIGHGKHLPTDAEQFKTWVVNMSTWKTKVIFSLRISTIDLDRVKTVVFAWCKQTSSYVKFINFRSMRIFGPDWFYGLSPYLHNRNNFEAYTFSIRHQGYGALSPSI